MYVTCVISTYINILEDETDDKFKMEERDGLTDCYMGFKGHLLKMAHIIGVDISHL